ncbi:MAG: TIGR02300 family protein [Rhizomicrobium sp.]
MGTQTLVKADLGTKRACPSCAARFYDLSRRPIECPKCGFSFEPEALYKQRRGRQPEPAQSIVAATDTEDEEAEEEGEEAEAEEETKKIEETPVRVAATGEEEDGEAAEEEEAEAESGMSVVEGGGDVAIEDIEVGEDDEEEEEADDNLLAEVEEEEDDVAGIIDPGIAKDEG